jgi:branched-chain amino acid transport system permease protein
LTNILTDNKRLLTTAIYVILAVLFLAWLFSPSLAGGKPPARLVQSTITGVLVGGIYALVALGIVIINKASGIFNFAHGWMMLIGGMMFYSFFTVAHISPLAAGLLALLTVVMALSTVSLRALLEPRNLVGGIIAVIILTLAMTIGGIEWQWLHAIVGAALGAVLLGLFVERFAIRPLIGQPLFAAVLMTLAIGEGVMRGTAQIIWGSVELHLPIFDSLPALGLPMPIRWDSKATFGDAFGGPVIVKTELLVAFVLALIAFAAFILFFRYTTIGLAMRATAESQRLAQSVGLRVRVILAVAWAIAALLAAIAGTLQGGATSLTLTMPLLALRAFPAVLLGGLESVGGALVGGLVIGLVEQWATLLFPNQVGTELAPYMVLMAVLVIRPDGLFGEKRIERI